MKVILDAVYGYNNYLHTELIDIELEEVYVIYLVLILSLRFFLFLLSWIDTSKEMVMVGGRIRK